MQRSVIEQLEVRQLLAAVIEPVVDYDTHPAGISAGGSQNRTVKLGDGLLILTISTLEHGSELWRTDGTANGTYRLTDLRPGPGSSNPHDLTLVGNQVYFSIGNPSSRNELWRTDGTVAGTVPVRDSGGEVIDGFIESLQAINDSQLTFDRFSDLWLTDGTAAGTTQLTELRSMNYSTHGSLTLTQEDGSRATFIAASLNGIGGSKLLRYDWATDAVQVMSAHDWVHLQAVYGSRLLFSARDAVHGEELWYSDGTPETTTLWSDLNPGAAGSTPYGFQVIGSSVYFSAETEAEGRELWKLSDHVASPQLIEIEPGSQSSTPSELVEHGGRFFAAYGGVYRLDEFDQPILISADTIPPSYFLYLPGSGLLQSGSAGLYLIYGPYNTLFNGLWLFSGPNISESIVRSDFDVIVAFVGEINGNVLFLAGEDGTGPELWISDGTEAGTQMVREIEPGTRASWPELKANLDGELVFTAGSRTQLAGTEEGAVHVLSASFYAPVSLADGSFNGDLNGVLWHSLVIEPGGTPFPAITTWDGSRFRLLVRLTDNQSPELELYPPVELSPQALVVWIRDSAQGTVSLWRVGANGELSERLCALDRMSQSVWNSVDARLYFSIRNESYTSQTLWQSDGTVAGTHPVPNLPVLGAYDSVEFGPGFVMAETVDRHGLHFMDTATGVVTTVASVFDSPTYFITRLMETSAGLLFSRTSSELWITTGTASSTKRLLDFSSSTAILPQAVSSDGSVWFFTYSIGESNSLSLWKTDGTSEGTMHVVELPGNKEFAHGSLTQLDGRLLFSTLDRDTGKSEVWLSDGTSDGTFVISDDLIIGGITQFMKYDDGIAFIAATPEIGREIFRIDTTIPATPPTGLTIDRQGAEPVLQWADSRGAVQYDVWLTNLSDPTTPVVRQRVNSPWFELPATATATAYRAWVRSVPVIGEPSAWSSPFEFTPGLNPVVFSVPAATTDATPTFRWVGSGDVASYELWVTHRDTKTRPIYVAGLTTTSFTPSTDLALGRYAVWVRATRTDGSLSDWSALTEFDIFLPAIRLTSANVSRISRPLFTWNAVAGTTHYELTVRRSDGSVAYTSPRIFGLSHAPTVELPSGSYSVHVRAMNGVRTLTMPGAADALHVLLPPTILTAINVGISWTPVPGAVTYTVELRNSAGQLHLPRMTVGGASIALTPPLVPGQYSVRVFTNFRQGSSDWSATTAFEVFRTATTRITSSNAPTTDATPIIAWDAVAGASGYEIRVARTATGPAIYTRTGITTANHRIATALPVGINVITVRALYADGSRTQWSAPQQLLIGPAPTLTSSGRTVSWSPVNQATHFELWINFLGTPPQQKIVYDHNYVAHSYQLASTMPRGRYQIWLRAIRAEGGELYPGLWSSIAIDLT